MIEESVASPSTESDPVEVREAAAVVQDAFRTLRPEQQRVLQLSIHHGCSHEQIATATGLPLGTVKTHARRGLIRLRQVLADAGVSPDGIGVSADGTA